ncbi:hypothetical protein AGMMS49938_00270 [Fibrobacterales bacterium]|nr:hypothetical protein AGMMS49938_00270 [Fibrobacterales bacterium]
MRNTKSKKVHRGKVEKVERVKSGDGKFSIAKIGYGVLGVWRGKYGIANFSGALYPHRVHNF